MRGEEEAVSTAIPVTKDNVESTIQDNNIVLLDFWAAWCGPCRFFAPIFDGAAADNPDIVFGKVDTEVERELASAFQITSIPTLVAIRDRTIVYSQPGALPAAALADVIAQVRAIDVEQLRQARDAAA
jgi:thioredoxin 1